MCLAEHAVGPTVLADCFPGQLAFAQDESPLKFAIATRFRGGAGKQPRPLQLRSGVSRVAGARVLLATRSSLFAGLWLLERAYVGPSNASADVVRGTTIEASMSPSLHDAERRRQPYCGSGWYFERKR